MAITIHIQVSIVSILANQQTTIQLRGAIGTFGPESVDCLCEILVNIFPLSVREKEGTIKPLLHRVVEKSEEAE